MPLTFLLHVVLLTWQFLQRVGAHVRSGVYVYGGADNVTCILHFNAVMAIMTAAAAAPDENAVIHWRSHAGNLLRVAIIRIL